MNCDHDKKSSFSTVSTPLQTFELTRCQLGDDRHPFVREPRGRFKLTPQSCKLPVEAIEHRLPRRSHKSQCLPLTGLFAPPPRPWSLRPRPAPSLARMLLIYPDVDSSEHTPAPGLVPDRQIRGFLFAFPHPVACPRFGQYAPKTSRTGSAVCHTFVIVIVGRIGEAVARRIGAGGEAQ
jgi:hypothetical protein